jgi:hypothetical protein
MLKSKVYWLFLLLLYPMAVFAQPGPPSDPAAPVPIPGIALIFLAGLLLGIFKLNRKKPE